MTYFIFENGSLWIGVSATACDVIYWRASMGRYLSVRYTSSQLSRYQLIRQGAHSQIREYHQHLNESSKVRWLLLQNGIATAFMRSWWIPRRPTQKFASLNLEKGFTFDVYITSWHISSPEKCPINSISRLWSSGASLEDLSPCIPRYQYAGMEEFYDIFFVQNLRLSGAMESAAQDFKSRQEAEKHFARGSDDSTKGWGASRLFFNFFSSPTHSTSKFYDPNFTVYSNII